MDLHEIAKVDDPITRGRLLTEYIDSARGRVDEAATMRRHAIAEARERGYSVGQIADRIGVTPSRVSQTSKGAKAPAGPAEPYPRVLVQRQLPTDPAVRGSKSLFLTEAAAQGIEPGRRMLFVGPEPAKEEIASRLGVSEGDTVIARRKLMTANEVPVRIATSYFREDLFGDTRIAEPEFVLPTLQAAIEALGYQFGRADEVLTIRKATPFEAHTLDLDPGEWVAQIIRASYSTEGTPIHTLETICAGSRHVFPIGQAAGADQF
ncbi:UTRA domain-containing protein [Nonomuraea sp. NPDC050786]|uniref:UTRA domain-containing protein n=1 Tax=Nonomuraea sp. NPDC050786 TaxID=3154840 RepID=UPI0033FC3C99